jgi:hypothetical protein
VKERKEFISDWRFGKVVYAGAGVKQSADGSLQQRVNWMFSELMWN